MHCLVDVMHASVVSQSRGVHGVAVLTTASSKDQSALEDGLSLALLATRTVEISAPFGPPPAMV